MQTRGWLILQAGVSGVWRNTSKKVQGVITTRVGYANSSVVRPSYEQVCSGATGAAETVEVLYNPDFVGLRVLTLLFLDVIDPWSVNRQRE